MPVGDQLRVLDAEILNNAAIPAYRPVRIQYIGNLLWRNGFPLQDFTFRTKQSGLVIEPVDDIEDLVAEHTLFALVPVIEHGAESATDGR